VTYQAIAVGRKACCVSSYQPVFVIATVTIHAWPNLTWTVNKKYSQDQRWKFRHTP